MIRGKAKRGWEWAQTVYEDIKGTSRDLDFSSEEAENLGVSSKGRILTGSIYCGMRRRAWEPG